MPRPTLTKLTKTTKYRAVCEENDFHGDWRDTRKEAIDDGLGHTNEPGKSEHVVHIIREEIETLLLNR